MTERLGYTLYAVYRRPELTISGADTSSGATTLVRLADRVAAGEFDALGVTIRGVYDVSGLRADADVLFWLTGEDPAALQEAVRRIRDTREIGALVPRWNALGVHREAEFAKDHSPAFMRGLPPKRWLTVYPFVRSYEWYILPEEERGAMLRDHGGKGREYPQVQSNTVASFALGDYEWLLALESDELIDLVDLMRHLRATQARLHVREEIPFFTGRMIGVDEIAGVVG
jgi:chlorite dismutase